MDATSRHQHGVITRYQALENGITHTELRELLRTGTWQRLLPGIYATFPERPPPATMRWAAVLHAGPGAMLCHRSAAEESGLAAHSPGPIHVLIPERRRVRSSPTLTIHRSRQAHSRRDPRRRPPQTRPEETVLDLASTAPTVQEAHHWIMSALTRRLTTKAQLADALSRRPRMFRRQAVATLIATANASATGPPAQLPPWPTLTPRRRAAEKPPSPHRQSPGAQPSP